MRVMTRIRYTLLELSLANNTLYESVIMCGYAEKTSSVIFYGTVAQLDKSNCPLSNRSGVRISSVSFFFNYGERPILVSGAYRWSRWSSFLK